MRDSNRSKVYAAENLVFMETLYCEPLGMTGVASLSDHLFVDEWWVRHINKFPEAVPTRRESHHSFADTTRQQLRFAVGHENAATLAHEAAHIATRVLHSGDIASHGVEFRATMLDVTSLLCGPVMAARLNNSYLSHGLKVGIRHRPAPPVVHERGIYALWRLGRHSATAGV